MNLRVPLSLIAAAILAGCETPSPDSVGLPAQHTEIRSVAVTDTTGAMTSGASTAVFDASQNGGAFKLSHDAVSTTQPYRAEWYISADLTLSADDKQILGRNCDIGVATDCPGESATFNCQYTSDVKIVCAAGTGTDTTDLTAYFVEQRGLPANYTLIFRACDGLMSDCKTRNIGAEFR